MRIINDLHSNFVYNQSVFLPRARRVENSVKKLLKKGIDMPKPIQPIFSEGFTVIGGQLGFECSDDTVTYYYGVMPIFSHDKNDIKTFHMISAQFYINGNATQADIARATGIPLITLKRAVKTYREGGPKAFYQEPRRGGPRVLTSDVINQAENLFDNGKNVGEVAKELGLKNDTLQKAIRSGRVKKKSP